MDDFVVGVSPVRLVEGVDLVDAWALRLFRILRWRTSLRNKYYKSWTQNLVLAVGK